MTPWKLIGYAITGLVIIAGVFAWNRHKDSQYEAALAKWSIQKKSADSAVAVAMQARDSALSQNAQSIPVYIQGRDRIIHDAAGTPAAKPVQACFDLADTRISKCQATIKADSDAIRSLQKDLKAAEDKPAPQLPRFQMYGAVGYSVTLVDKETRTAPAFRAGIDTKLIGPVRLSTDAQLTMPGHGKSNPMLQANLMARINF